MADGQGRRPPYFVAARLTATARARWHEFDGWAASRGADPLDLDFDRFLNLVYYWLVRGANERRRAQIDADLNRPPKGEDRIAATEDPDSPWSAESEMAAFHQAQRAAGGV